MICIKCAAEIPDGSLYCNLCGKKQTATQRPARKRANGEGSVFRYRNGWRAQAVVGRKLVNGKSRPIYATKAGFKTKREALEYLPVLAKEEKTRHVPSLTELWQQYQQGKYRKLSASRQEKYRIAWPKLQELHDDPIDVLTLADLQATVNAGAKTYYPARDMRDLLSILYQLAMVDRFVPVNLAEHIDLPEVNAKAQDAFTPEEITALWEDYAAGNRWTGYVLLMIYTGMMPGELMQVRKENVNLEAHTIYGEGLKTAVRKKKPIILPEVIVPVLADLMSATDGEKIIRVNKDNFYDYYYAVLERAGTRRLVPYSCRHTTATVLDNAAVTPVMIQSIMRHASFSTTSKYIHERIDREIAAANTAAGTIKQKRQSETDSN